MTTRSPSRIVLTIPAMLFAALFGTVGVYVLGMRSKSTSVRRGARAFHHAVGNRLQMRSAGTPGSYASVIRHRGRTTGREYETPVWAAPTEDGFVIGVVYGPRTDWLRNLRASGSASIVHEGRTYAVSEPRMVPAESAARYLPPAIRHAQRLVGVDRYVRIRGREIATGDEEETMQQPHGHVVEYTKARRFMREAIRSTHHKPLMHGLVEVDVTRARSVIERVEAETGESLSFTAFIIGCVGRAVDEHPYVHALWNGRRHLIMFDDVDVLTWIERDVGDGTAVLPCIVRAADRRSIQELSADIRAAQVQDLATIDVGGAKESQMLPAWAFRPYFALVTRVGKRFPQLWKRTWGTITLTAVGMIGEGAGWGIPPSSPSICWITVGGIAAKEEEDAGGRVVSRDYLNLTVSIDHNMVDAAPAARFTTRLRELIESGYGLPVDGAAGAAAGSNRSAGTASTSTV
jgi:deazaflavin-dependent oxidoreductase (nitroreductase family)